MKTIAASTIALLLTLFSAPAYAADATRSSITGNEALATFNSFNGCDDNVVGVTVRENSIQNGSGGKERISEVSVFGSFENICEFGSSSSFFGSTTLERGEFTQNGLDSATLTKTLTIDGHEIHLDLTWSGTGEILLFESKIKDNGNPRVRGKEEISMRSADVTGTFVVDGLDHASGDPVVNGNLSLIRLAHTSIVK
jgi:hypothetical protein